jgi:YidC/Oxa1 family membrane protein insertase
MIGNIFRTILTYPILNLMVVLYHILFSNLGLAIIAVAIISRLALIPLSKTQIEMTKKMAKIKPELDKLQKKYANNPEKLSQEQMKLYKKEGYNPLGCLGSFIPQLIILSVLIGVVRALTGNNTEGIYPFVLDWVSGGTGQFNIDPTFFGLDLTQTYNDLSGEFGRFAAQAIPYLVLALVVGAVQFVTTKLTTVLQNPEAVKEKKKAKKGIDGEPDMQAMQNSMQKSMMFMFPLMTIFISISAPAALGIYWITQSIMLIAQYFILDFDRSKRGVQNLFTKYKEKFAKKK